MSLPYKLDDSYRIVANDARQWTLQRLRDERDESTMDEDDARPARPDDKKGVEMWSDVGWFGTIDALCRVYVQRYARTSDDPLPQALAKATNRLKKVLAEVKAATANL